MHLITDLSSIKRYQTPDSRNTGVSNIKETGGKLIVQRGHRWILLQDIFQIKIIWYLNILQKHTKV